MPVRYVTRWALSTGIRKETGEYVDGKYFKSRDVFVSAKEAHETLDDAIRCAKLMAEKKAKSLRKQADVLSDPNWEPNVI